MALVAASGVVVLDVYLQHVVEVAPTGAPATGSGGCPPCDEVYLGDVGALQLTK
jgi:hypothetical protein